MTSGEWIAFHFGEFHQAGLTAVELVREIVRQYPLLRDRIWDLEILEAIYALDRMPEPAGDEELLALIALYGQIGFPQGAPRIDSYVEDPRYEVRLTAIRSLGQMGRYGSIPLILPFLDDPDPTFRSVALAALGKFGVEELVPYIEPGLADVQTRAAAEQALAETRALINRQFDAFADALLPTPDYEDLISWATFVRERLQDVLASTEAPPTVRLRAARILAITRSQLQAELMAVVAENANEPLPLRDQCAAGVGRCRQPQHLEVLERLLAAPDPSLQEAAARGLVEFGDGRAFEILDKGWEGLQGSEPAVMDALGAFELPDAHERLRSWMEGVEDVAARVVLIDDSGRILREYDAGALQAALASDSAGARLDAAWLIALLGTEAEHSLLERMSREDPVEENRRSTREMLARLRRRS